MAEYDLLIFDLDGTLVPTEQIAARLMGQLIPEHLGLELTPDELVERFMGRDLNSQFADIATLYGGPLPQTFFDALNAAWVEAVETELEPSAGAIDALRELYEIPRCIASNGEREGIELALRATGLNEYFDRFFSAEDVEHPKPAPDLYLLAAKSMGVTSDRCLVVEDTIVGVRAAQSAGMDVVGYVGNGSHAADVLRDAGAVVISHFSELAGVVHGD
jgi:HAD superfamily hydrolase (TIGR01509 family)